MLNDKVVFVTGGTGSFGRAFVSYIAENFSPRKLIVFSRDEFKQSEMARDFPVDRYPFMRYFIGDVRDVERLEMAMREVDYVIHAAAMKHIDIAEYNPFECVRTNIYGTENIVRAALRCGVDRVIALSTDKAVNPHNHYGACKLAADKIMVAAKFASGSIGTRFGVVRYGNVFGSRGSVVPLFSKRIAEGATSLPITDERMTRFWVTLPQAVSFVLACLEKMEGGEIFIPKSPSTRIVDLAKAMDPDLDHEIIGMRPGEKIHETLISNDDAASTWEFPDHYLIEPHFGSDRADARKASGGARVAEDFFYRSDNNPGQLTPEEITQLLENNPQE